MDHRLEEIIDIPQFQILQDKLNQIYSFPSAIIDGVNYANFFTGQFFLEEPDLDFFRAQAARYGFDEEACLETMRRVPVWSREQLDSYLYFIKGLIAIISESGGSFSAETGILEGSCDGGG